MPSKLFCDFTRVSTRVLCPICSKPDWCLVGKPGTDFEGCAICQRTVSPFRFRDAGWLHRPCAAIRSKPGLLRKSMLSWRQGDAEQLARFAASATASLSAESLRSLSQRLDLTIESLRRLGVGEVSRHLADEYKIAWADAAWTFPMHDAAGAVTGIRLRLRDGSKYALPGGREGLFVPVDVAEAPEQLLICEGPTDTAAMLDLGFPAVGRPSCGGGKREILTFVKTFNPRSVVVVADRDEAGVRGARDLACALATRVAEVRIVEPPVGVKDARSWKRSGGSVADVRAAISASPPLRSSILVRRGGR